MDKQQGAAASAARGAGERAGSMRRASNKEKGNGGRA